MADGHRTEWYRLAVGAVGLQMITIGCVGTLADEEADRQEMHAFLRQVLPQNPAQPDQADWPIAATVGSAPTAASTGAAASSPNSPARNTTHNQ